MGSGNKDKRKKRLSSGDGQPPARPAPFDKIEKTGKSGKTGSWSKAGPPVGVSFELEPDADRLFLESIESIDPKLVAKKARLDAESDVGPGGGGGGSAAARAGGGMTEIDLHRLTLDEATMLVENAIEIALQGGRGETTIKIITGKGLHSGPDGGVLTREIHRHVRQRFAMHIVSIEDSPAEVTIGGVPIRGHFHVKLRRKG